MLKSAHVIIMQLSLPIDGIATTLSRMCGELGSSGFPKASSRVSAGTNDGEAPATLLQYDLPGPWVGFIVTRKSHENQVGSPGYDPHFDETD